MPAYSSPHGRALNVNGKLFQLRRHRRAPMGFCLQAVALEHCREDEAFPQDRAALLGGYAEMHSLPEEQLKHLDLFMAAFDVYWSLWATAITHLYPDYREGLAGRLERSARLVARYVANS
jgi:Ser/Thr protein kinase RdoA (MazF antagonist)